MGIVTLILNEEGLPCMFGVGIPGSEGGMEGAAPSRIKMWSSPGLSRANASKRAPPYFVISSSLFIHCIWNFRNPISEYIP